MGRARGTFLIILAALIGLAVALYDYETVSTGIDHSEGVMLVIVSTALMLGAALVAGLLGRGAVAGILMFLILLDILGTGTAAWFLESWLLLIAMAIAAIGWLSRIAAPRRPA